MKYFLLIMLLSTMVFSCKKEKNLGPLYELFIGRWEPENQSEDTFIEFSSDGIIKYSRGVERQLKYDVDLVRQDNPGIYEGELWNVIRFLDEDKFGNYNGFLVLYNETVDTILRYKYQLHENGEYNSVDIEKLYFVRQ